MKNYEINDDTLALIPLSLKETKVVESEDEYIVENSINKIMEESCEYFGCTMTGRKKASINMIGTSYKAPIIIEESRNIIFFPTSSPRSNECNWISLNNLESYEKKDNNTIILKFKNNKDVIINTTYGIIDNQVFRAMRLEAVLKKRINENNNRKKKKNV